MTAAADKPEGMPVDRLVDAVYRARPRKDRHAIRKHSFKVEAERGNIIGYLVWHGDFGSLGPIWPTLAEARKFADSRREGDYHGGASYRVVVVSELPDGGTR